MATMAGPRLLLQRLGLVCSCRVFVLAVLLVAGAPRRLAASSGRVVTSLPGFDGPLPFHLETGYVEVDADNGAELFYYFVESESVSSEPEPGDAAEDAPFLLWLTGGDRCSVFSGLAYEIGLRECIIVQEAKPLKSHPRPRRSSQIRRGALQRNAATPAVQPKLLVQGKNAATEVGWSFLWVVFCGNCRICSARGSNGT